MNRFIQNTVSVANPDTTMVHQRSTPDKAKAFDPLQMNIFLVGLRASGKTTLGRRLAKRLGMRFVDTDEQVASQAGRDIAGIVATDGWEAFRRLESEILKRVCAERGQVVATGGGIVLAPENQRLIRESGTTFYLMAEIATLLRRLNADPATAQRPPLSGLPLDQELIQTNMQRGPLYMSLADHILRTEDTLKNIGRDALDKLGVA